MHVAPSVSGLRGEDCCREKRFRRRLCRDVIEGVMPFGRSGGLHQLSPQGTITAHTQGVQRGYLWCKSEENEEEGGENRRLRRGSTPDSLSYSVELT